VLLQQVMLYQVLHQIVHDLVALYQSIMYVLQQQWTQHDGVSAIDQHAAVSDTGVTQ
jgi:hypothetical protein